MNSSINLSKNQLGRGKGNIKQEEMCGIFFFLAGGVSFNMRLRYVYRLRRTWVKSQRLTIIDNKDTTEIKFLKKRKNRDQP